MYQDRRLVRELREGSKDALPAIYEKYGRLLLTVAANLLHDRTAAEDVVQDVFVAFARSAPQFCLRGTLRGYLAACVANRARDYGRRDARRPTVTLASAEHVPAPADTPVQLAIRSEELEVLSRAIMEVPYEQREVIVLRLHAAMKFRQIAEMQKVSVKTVLSRYRYGLNKLRSRMNGDLRT